MAHLQLRGSRHERRARHETLWQEFAFGMLDGAGEVLIDDVSVVQLPSSSAIERIQNGNFSAGNVHWRRLGNHQRSGVIPEPGNPSNMVLASSPRGRPSTRGIRSDDLRRRRNDR